MTLLANFHAGSTRYLLSRSNCFPPWPGCANDDNDDDEDEEDDDSHHRQRYVAWEDEEEDEEENEEMEKEEEEDTERARREARCRTISDMDADIYVVMKRQPVPPNRILGTLRPRL